MDTRFSKHIHVSVTEECYETFKSLCTHKGDFTHIIRSVLEDFARTKVKATTRRKKDVNSTDAQESPCNGTENS